MAGRSGGRTAMLLGAITIFVFVAVYFGIAFTSDWGQPAGEASASDADKRLDRLVRRIDVTIAEPVKGIVDLAPVQVGDSLPDIEKYPVTVQPATGSYAEIFSSTEKGGEGVDGWLTEAAQAFNDAGIVLNGERVSVKLRNIASGTASDYIRSGKYVPDAFTPSNELWGAMIQEDGIPIELLSERLVGNVAGIVTKKAKHDELVAKYGFVGVKTLTDALAENELAMGYTDPFASSTGLNFLVTSLETYGGGNPLGEEAVQGFQRFQANVPFIASTTLQMREAAKSGMLDAFVLEYQTYMNSPDLRSEYVFTPFGVRHDSPLYGLGDLTVQKRDILLSFAEFVTRERWQQEGTRKGFNGLEEYRPESKPIDGSMLEPAQKLWKEKKNGGQEVAAVFVADVSGSMDGEPLNRLKESLLAGQKVLGRENSIGLVSYSSEVRVELPIGTYDTNQQSMFVGAVESLRAGGETATFDGIAVAMKLLREALVARPQAKPVIFVLSDGETNTGHSLDDIRSLVEAYRIPIYTIGYNANVEALKSISAINEAVSMNADTDDVVYKIGNLLNAQM
ncbi:VWA domain-containing protein [Paenibacillus sp. PAMC21692]|uniref:VWA domain-containing protein n=1 Tax=Paenibacillus sp. PAMC21692 TaxID=2762320 RepID=UPI00164D718D|nr:VWA domain-containing protein [Paenibacillus sp. PAMC21692]QNK56844.1 VWA domain-containing protein [Paenibacillus sp. PAMC21692]